MEFYKSPSPNPVSNPVTVTSLSKLLFGKSLFLLLGVASVSSSTVLKAGSLDPVIGFILVSTIGVAGVERGVLFPQWAWGFSLSSIGGNYFYSWCSSSCSTYSTTNSRS